MYEYDFIVKQGESFIQDVKFKSKTTKEPIVFLETAMAKAQIREHPGVEEIVAEINCDLHPNDGVVNLYLDRETTSNIAAGIYYYDLTITEEDNTIYYLQGRFVIKKHVTEVINE